MSKITNLFGLLIFYIGMCIVFIGMKLITDKKVQNSILDSFKKAGVKPI